MADTRGRTRKSTPGIRPRHREGCRSHEGGRCSCSPGYEAWAFDAREGRKLRRTFPTLAAPKGADADLLAKRRPAGPPYQGAQPREDLGVVEGLALALLLAAQDRFPNARSR